MGEGFTTTIGAPSTIEFIVVWFVFIIVAPARAFFILDVDQSTILVIARHSDLLWKTHRAQREKREDVT